MSGYADVIDTAYGRLFTPDPSYKAKKCRCGFPIGEFDAAEHCEDCKELQHTGCMERHDGLLLCVPCSEPWKASQALDLLPMVPDREEYEEEEDGEATVSTVRTASDVQSQDSEQGTR